MKKMLAVLLAVLALGLLWPRADEAGKPCEIPKSWGSLKAVSFSHYGAVAGQDLVFEAEDGTIRITKAECGSPAKATVILRVAD
jgi:hypothetical protein